MSPFLRQYVGAGSGLAARVVPRDHWPELRAARATRAASSGALLPLRSVPAPRSSGQWSLSTAPLLDPREVSEECQRPRAGLRTSCLPATWTPLCEHSNRLLDLLAGRVGTTFLVPER